MLFRKEQDLSNFGNAWEKIRGQIELLRKDYEGFLE